MYNTVYLEWEFVTWLEQEYSDRLETAISQARISGWFGVALGDSVIGAHGGGCDGPHAPENVGQAV